jgi:hypothetical protein
MRGHPIRMAIAVASVASALHGCAAIPLAVIAAPLLDVGGGVLVKTGTEYSARGTAYRTFSLPVEQVHAAVLETFRRAQITVTRDDASPMHDRIAGKLYRRDVHVELLPLTPVLTSMELVVKRNILASDKATASELLAQTEQILLPEHPAVNSADPRIGHRHRGNGS